jgi:hypothetical protein
MMVVFDMDGCLADCSARVGRYLIESPMKDWDGLFTDDAIASDKPIWPTIDVMMSLMGNLNRVMIWTGRPERTRVATVMWLNRFGIYLPPDMIWMRAEGDWRDDHMLKGEWCDQRRPDAVFEDRDRIVAMYRARGITCYQTQPGNF